MNTVSVKTTSSEVEITITELARAFWELASDEQAYFFDQLGAVIEEDHKHNSRSYGYGEMQWCYLRDELKKPGMERANNMHMALSAFAYDFVDIKLNGCRT